MNSIYCAKSLQTCLQIIDNLTPVAGINKLWDEPQTVASITCTCIYPRRLL